MAKNDEPVEVNSETAADALDKIEEAVNTLAENWVDNGDGAQPHITNLKRAVQGLRDAQRSRDTLAATTPRTR